MLASYSPRFLPNGLACASVLLAVSVALPARAQTENSTNPMSTVVVEVMDNESGNPISQARLTLQFEDYTGHRSRTRIPKRISYSAKTNAQGRYRFTGIYKGKIHLFVTADRHQSFGKEYDLTEDNQVIQVKLKKPQPLL